MRASVTALMHQMIGAIHIARPAWSKTSPNVGGSPLYSRLRYFDPVARRAELIAEYTEKYANPYAAAERGYIDDVIDPAETRKKVVDGFRMLRTKREELPRRKHGNMPL